MFSIELSTEAGTGHNAFQRFARLAAALENDVPAIYIYPEATIVKRKVGKVKWDTINPLIFKALSDMIGIYRIPSLLFYYPSDYREYKDNPLDSPHIRTKGLIMSPVEEFAACPDWKSDSMRRMFEVLDLIIDN